MDTARIPELIERISRAVQDRVPDRICLVENTLNGPHRFGYVFQIGQDKVWLTIQESHNTTISRINSEFNKSYRSFHYITIRTPSLKGRSKVIRETRDGWFTVSTISSLITKLLQLEVVARQNAAHDKHLYQSAHNAVERLKRSELPPNVTLDVGRTPGSISLKIDVLTEHSASEIINYVRLFTKETGKRELWDHLKED